MRSQVIFRSHDPRQDVFSLSIDGLPRLERFGSPSQSGNLPVPGVFSTTPRVDAPERNSDFVFTWDVRTELSTDQLSRRQGLSRRNSQIDGTKK